MLGCYVEGPEKMLVYEYLPNKRASLFTRGSPERIIHKYIKARNILVDDKLHQKISDFGLARLIPWEDIHFNFKHIISS